MELNASRRSRVVTFDCNPRRETVQSSKRVSQNLQNLFSSGRKFRISTKTKNSKPEMRNWNRKRTISIFERFTTRTSCSITYNLRRSNTCSDKCPYLATSRQPLEFEDSQVRDFGQRDVLLVEYVHESVSLIVLLVKERLERHDDGAEQVRRSMAMRLIEHRATAEDHRSAIGVALCILINGKFRVIREEIVNYWNLRLLAVAGW